MGEIPQVAIPDRRYKKPKKVLFVAELPKLVTGKVDKKRLRAEYAITAGGARR
ncbi:MAG: hypothetical protein WDA10_10655 [Porticoccaceae bacterium]|nr:hypothetical protein [Porticoccaceae bacterium]